MKLTRRQALGFSAGAAAFAITGLRVAPANAGVEEAKAMMMDFSGGKEPVAGKLTLTAPEIAENGNTVPISVSVDSAMSGDDMVEAVMIIAEDNPNPGVATFRFTEMSGAAAATTRMRLARTQNVIALARMKDGSVYSDTRQVKVTIGGCGG
jgi:sulfur-oxidizing protein SoxY